MALVLQAQEKKVAKAETKFANYAFSSAIQSYEDLVAAGYSQERIFKNLGNANYYNARYDEASHWYGKLLRARYGRYRPRIHVPLRPDP